MRDTWRIFDSYIFLYIYIPSTSREISTTRVSRPCVCIYTHTYMRGLSFLSGEKGKRRPVFWIFDEREHDVPPEFHSGPSRNACRWYFSARQIRVYMVKCSILSGESSYKREFLTFNARVHRPPPRFKRKHQIRADPPWFFRQFLSGISFRWSSKIFCLFLLGEYRSFTITSFRF